MDEQPRAKQITSVVLTVILWLVTFVMGLEGIHALTEILSLVYVGLGGSTAEAGRFIPVLVFVLGLFYLVFIIASTEFHMKRAGTHESWRLFGWTLAVEVSILVLYYLL